MAKSKASNNATISVLSAREVADMMSKEVPELSKLHLRDREIVALYAANFPADQITNIVGVKIGEVRDSIDQYGALMENISDSLRIAIWERSIMRFVGVAISIYMDAKKVKDMTPAEASKAITQLPELMNTIAKIKASIERSEGQGEAMNWGDFGKSLTNQ